MKIHLLRERATQDQVAEMLEALDTYIKLAVDIERGIAAGGGTMHHHGEQVLLDDGSRQENIWGADWDPVSKQIQFEALINIRPHQNNRTMRIQDSEIRDQVSAIVTWLFADVT